jgi:CRP/FNR family transcriptional regulator
MSVPLPQLEAQYPVLAELPQQLRQQIAAAAQSVTVPPGTTLFDERQPCQGFPFILAGAIRVAKVAANGRELPLYRVTPGETCIITSSCLLGNVPYNARGTTESETVLTMLPQGLFTELLAQPPFRTFIFNLFAERMADLMRLVEEVAFRKLDQRLAALLLGKGRILATTHQQLADELGSVREIVSRLLKGFAEQGLVSLGREQVEILDPAGLRRIASTTR